VREVVITGVGAVPTLGVGARARARSTASGPLLLTGATGFVGMELLVRVLEQTDRDVIALVRADDDDAAQERIDGVLQTLFAPDTGPEPGRVRGLAADLEAPGLGLTAPTRDRLIAEVQAICHCAASISFTLELDHARRINVEGTREIVRLAADAHEYGSLDRLVHVSTAYVAGERSGRASEHESDVGQRFRNTYERTKLEAEHVVQDSGVPAAILRPSVIVGDSVTGWTPSFNVVYWPLQAFARGLFPAVPGEAGAHLDIVPVDVVADSLLALLRGPTRSGVFHAVAGDDAPTNATLATMAADAFDTAPPRFVGPGEDPTAETRAGPFLPYFRVRCIFDAIRGRALGVASPSIEEYFPALMRYARDARWGKEPQPRWAVGRASLRRVA
jgi:long-chain acyl-CoA synthetase